MFRRTVMKASLNELINDLKRKTTVETAKMNRGEKVPSKWKAIRWFFRERKIDRLAKQIEEHDKYDFHPSYKRMMDLTTVLVVMVPCGLLFYDIINPFRALVWPIPLLTAEQFQLLVDATHQNVVWFFQFCFFLWWMDFSAHVRYRFFANYMSPFYRKMGWVRRTADSSGAKASPMRSGGAQASPSAAATNKRVSSMFRKSGAGGAAAGGASNVGTTKPFGKQAKPASGKS